MDAVVEELEAKNLLVTDEGARRFANKLRHLGVDDELRKKGIMPGDIVRILDFEFEFKD